MKSAYSAASTGYETHAAFRKKGMAAAAKQAVDIGVALDEEMIEAEGMTQQLPKGSQPDYYW